MPKMALLLATDTWEKMGIFQDFLETHPTAIWRSKQKLTPETLGAIPFPINLYFFHRNVIGYRAHCVDIQRGNPTDWPLSLTPPAFHDDHEPYTMGLFFDKFETVQATHIRLFPKW